MFTIGQKISLMSNVFGALMHASGFPFPHTSMAGEHIPASQIFEKLLQSYY
jgi:hypothetical protein